MAISRPKKGEFAPFHETYLNAVPKGTLLAHLKKTQKETLEGFAKFPISTHEKGYAEGKWNLKQKLAHIIDTERVFGFRALWIARGEKAPLPGFNQDDWAAKNDVSDRNLADLMKEFKIVRAQTMLLIATISDENSKNMGVASNWPIASRTMLWCIVGHNYHHLNLLRDRYSVLLTK
jgi:hypothetical protein